MLKYLGILSLFNILNEKRTASNKCDKLISNIFLSHYHLLKPASHTVFTSFEKSIDGAISPGKVLQKVC